MFLHPALVWPDNCDQTIVSDSVNIYSDFVVQKMVSLRLTITFIL